MSSEEGGGFKTVGGVLNGSRSCLLILLLLFVIVRIVIVIVVLVVVVVVARVKLNFFLLGAFFALRPFPVRRTPLRLLRLLLRIFTSPPAAAGAAFVGGNHRRRHAHRRQPRARHRLPHLRLEPSNLIRQTPRPAAATAAAAATFCGPGGDVSTDGRRRRL